MHRSTPRSGRPAAASSVLAATGLVLLLVMSMLPVTGGAETAERGAEGRDLASADADDVTLTLVDVTSWFGPETYKEADRANTRTMEDFGNQTGTWTTSLGHAISFGVRVSANSGSGVTCDTRFEPVAYIETGAGRLYGWTNGTVDAAGTLDCSRGPAGVRYFNVTFDLDGAANPAGDPFPALLGPQVAVLELYHQERPTPPDTSMRGPRAGQVELPFTVAPIGITLDKPLYRYPDSVLRTITDAGGGNRFFMPAEPYAHGDELTVTLDLAGTTAGTNYEAHAWRFSRLATGGAEAPASGPLPQSPLGPVADHVTDADERGTTATKLELRLGNGTVPQSRQVSGTLNASDLRPAGAEHTPLHVFALHLPASADNLSHIVTGAATVVVPVVADDFPVRSVTLGGFASEGAGAQTRITLVDQERVLGGPTGADAGDLFALTTEGFGFQERGRGTLARDPDRSLVTGAIDHGAFYSIREGDYVLDETPLYRLMAMLYDENDGFRGMESVQRGVEISAPAVRTVEGENAQVVFTITSLTTDFDAEPREAGFRMDVRVLVTDLPNAADHNRTVTIEEGATVQLEVPFNPDRPCDCTARIQVSAGEILATKNVAIKVLSQEEAAAGNKKWYEIPAPPVALVALSLVLLAALARRRVL